MRHLFLLCLCGCVLLLAGFAWPHGASALGAQLVAPGATSPLLPVQRIDEALARLPTRQGFVHNAEGVPLFWRALDPGAYRLDYAYAAGAAMDFELDFTAPQAVSAPRGTVLLLHGWMMDGGSLLPWSLQLAQAGYRSISLDLRNHGRS